MISASFKLRLFDSNRLDEVPLVKPLLNTEALIRHLRAEVAGRHGSSDDVLVHEERLPGRQARGALLRPALPRPLAAALQAAGVKVLYEHQVAAIQAVRAGENVVVTTPTASGKTFCFNLPVLERMLLKPGRHALYLYPTKALMADQLRGLADLCSAIESSPSIRVAKLDGDVQRGEREILRSEPPDILIANPDIVHYEMLARSYQWQRFLAALDFIVVDELHAYRGVFGSHVSLILRRLLRRCAGLGATPAVIAASATIANPEELASQLTGLPFTAVSADGAASYPRRFLLWRPPLKGDSQFNEHVGANQEAVDLFVELLHAGRTAILFGRSRLAVERMLANARGKLPGDLAAMISGYKSGYALEERARIEADLRAGKLRGVIATNALELGIDVGALDAAILAGYPGSVMSTWQQAGRVGRRDGEEAIIILVGGDDALDQYFLNHPALFFGQPNEQALIDPGNELILLNHLLCAAAESPIAEHELPFFPPEALRLVHSLVREELLSPKAPWRLRDATQQPHRRVSVRGVSRDQYQVLDGRRLIATVEPPHLYREAFPGAIYLHQGMPYRVMEIDQAAKHVRVRRDTTGGRTDAIVNVSVAPAGELIDQRSTRLGEISTRLSIGALVVDEEVAAFRETFRGSRTPSTKSIASPCRFRLTTIGVWLDVPESLRASANSLHTAEHALANALPIALLCDRRDVQSTNDVAAGAGGRIYLFDAYEGGMGIAEKTYQLWERLAAAALDIVRSCRCADGCPSCIHLPGCPTANDGLDKAGGQALLSGQQVERVPVLTRRRHSAEKTAGDSGVEGRLRRLAEDGLRRRLAEARSIKEGDVLDYTGYGPVVVLEIAGERALVQFKGSVAKMWTTVALLRPLGKSF